MSGRVNQINLIFTGNGYHARMIAIVLTFLMLAVMVYDASRFIIPNWVNGLVLALFPYLLLTQSGVDWKTAYLGLLATFAVGYVLFALRLMGAGDVKLFAALAPFIAALGWMPLIQFLMLVTIAGGGLTLVLLFLRKIIPFIATLPADTAKLRILRDKAPVPYGLAIAWVFLGYLWLGKTVVSLT